jgi:biopolymer transport protein ExbD
MSTTGSSRSIRTRKRARRIQKGFELQLTSMMDVLVIIVVFLLKSYMTSTNSFTTVPGLKLPLSASQDVPADSLHVIITPEAITFENERIVEFVQTGAGLGGNDATYAFRTKDLDEGNRRVLPLYDALIKARDKSELLRAKSKARDAEGNPLPFEGVLAIQADKRVHYDTLRKIMYTAGAAGFKVFRLLAMRRDS